MSGKLLLAFSCLVFTLGWGSLSEARADKAHSFGQAKTQVLTQTAEIKEEAARTRKMLAREKAELSGSRKALQTQVADLEAQLNRLEKQFKSNLELERRKREELAEDETEAKNLEAAVRLSAKEVERLLDGSLVSAEHPERSALLAPLKDQRLFPSLENIQTLTESLFLVMEAGGHIVSREGRFIDRQGQEAEGRILRVGNFTAYYRTGEEVGFLQTGQKAGELRALASKPPFLEARKINKYLEGQSRTLPLDPSGGTALTQLKADRTISEWVVAGGFLVWPILLLGAVALILILERLVSLGLIRSNSDMIMARLKELAARNKWTECLEVCDRHPRTPTCRVLKAGLKMRSAGREGMEAAVEEAVLKELPRLERFLQTLSVLAAIAPLLGLLGTVTGMINTFQVITRFGASDPRLMAGGISEALITTQLGLAVAMPIIIIHHLFERRVDKILGDMEEKGMGLTGLTSRDKVIEEPRNPGGLVPGEVTV